jgi:ribose-phosphate pyrophosphokinase
MACTTHGVLSGPAIERLNSSPFTQVLVTDTIPLGDKLAACPKLKVLSIAGLLAKAINNIHTESSVSVLFV